ncbi:hypothetical protein TNCV_3209501 [Trichonephila clavipes]|nr:hypothetical protein TNCV_3209501 [Trichonephila clavipes]
MRFLYNISIEQSQINTCMGPSNVGFVPLYPLANQRQLRHVTRVTSNIHRFTIYRHEIYQFGKAESDTKKLFFTFPLRTPVLHPGSLSLFFLFFLLYFLPSQSGVPSHVGFPGNERAEQKANQGTESSQQEVPLIIKKANVIISTYFDKCTVMTQRNKILGKPWVIHQCGSYPEAHEEPRQLPAFA